MTYVQGGLPEWYSCQQSFITFKLFLFHLPTHKPFQGVFMVYLKPSGTGTSCIALFFLCFLDQLHLLHKIRRVCLALTNSNRKVLSSVSDWNDYKTTKCLIMQLFVSTSKLLLQKMKPGIANISNFTSFIYRFDIFLSQKL